MYRRAKQLEESNKFVAYFKKEAMRYKNENNIELTVIIPVYNAELYLEQCVDSLMNQGNLQMEMVLVNDGSTDRSGAMADRYALRDKRIKVIYQESDFNLNCLCPDLQLVF